jgi:hypothetical protein
VTVNALPTVSILQGSAVSYCAGGAAQLSASPAASYLWSNGATTQTINVNAPGNYSVQVTATNGCVAASTATAVTQIALPTALITASGPTTICQGNTVVLTASPASSYAWSNGASTQDISALAAGTYAVTVTDNLGCTATQTNLIVTQPTAVSVTNTSTNVSCNGGTNGTIPVTVSGGTSPYSYIWSNGTTTEDLNNIAAGSFSLTVSDANGCIRNLGPINITQPTALAISNVSTTIANSTYSPSFKSVSQPSIKNSAVSTFLNLTTLLFNNAIFLSILFSIFNF